MEKCATPAHFRSGRILSFNFLSKCSIVCVMNNAIAEQFRAALNFLLYQEGRGAQVRLAVAQNIDRGYLNAVIKGRKPAAEEIRLKIADHFGMLYEEMLVFGRRVQEGLVKTEEGKGAEGSDVEIENNSGNGISSKTEQVRRILESGTDYGQAVSSLIDTVHQAIKTDRKSRRIENRLEEIERRLELVEKEYASVKKVAQRSKKKILKRDG
jgi:tetrahydromethanopterin S-methyltransferase subunit G